MKDVISPVYRERRAKLICYAGAVCSGCGIKYDGTNGAAFVFHHVDNPEGTKCFQLTVASMGRPWKELEEEVKKTQLLCHNCHSMQHSARY